MLDEKIGKIKKLAMVNYGLKPKFNYDNHLNFNKILRHLHKNKDIIFFYGIDVSYYSNFSSNFYINLTEPYLLTKRGFSDLRKKRKGAFQIVPLNPKPSENFYEFRFELDKTKYAEINKEWYNKNNALKIAFPIKNKISPYFLIISEHNLKRLRSLETFLAEEIETSEIPKVLFEQIAENYSLKLGNRTYKRKSFDKIIEEQIFFKNKDKITISIPQRDPKDSLPRDILIKVDPVKTYRFINFLSEGLDNKYVQFNQEGDILLKNSYSQIHYLDKILKSIF